MVLAIQSYGAEKKVAIDTLYISNGELLVSFHVNNLIDDKMIEGLKRGFTSEIVHKVQLWRRKKLLSQLVTEKYYTIKIYYDNWDEKFAVITESENRLTANIDRVREICSVVREFSVADSTRLDENAKYYLTVETTFQPISAETYQDLRDWVAGKTHRSGKAAKPKKRRGKLFGVLVDLLGFGDKVFSYKSDSFRIDEKRQVRYLK